MGLGRCGYEKIGDRGVHTNFLGDRGFSKVILEIFELVVVVWLLLL